MRVLFAFGLSSGKSLSLLHVIFSHVNGVCVCVHETIQCTASEITAMELETATTAAAATAYMCAQQYLSTFAKQ